MSTHPLSLRRQLLFGFEDVAEVRFEQDNQGNIFRILLSTGESGHTDPRLSKHLNEHRSICSSIELVPWVPGALNDHLKTGHQ